MRRYRPSVARIALAFVLAGCSVAAPPTDEPLTTASAPLTERPPSETPTSPPTSSATTSPSATASEVATLASTDPSVALIREAARTTIEAGTMRFQVEVRPSEPVEGVSTSTGSGQVSFSEPMQFRVFSNAFTGLGGTSPEYEVIFDDPRIYLRGREALPDSPDTWLVIDFDLLGSGEMIRKRYVSNYSHVLFILVPALGVFEAEVVGSDTLRSDMLNGVAATHYSAVATFDVPSEDLPPSARDAYRDQLGGLNASDAPRTFEVDVWIDAKGRIVRISSVNEIESEDVRALIVTYDIASLGAPMDLSVPRGAEVLTVDDLQQMRNSPSPSPSR